MQDGERVEDERMDEDEVGDEENDEYDSDLAELDEEKIFSEFNVSSLIYVSELYYFSSLM